jgi:hypothetical protein
VPSRAGWWGLETGDSGAACKTGAKTQRVRARLPSEGFMRGQSTSLRPYFLFTHKWAQPKVVHETDQQEACRS